jgi:hypothetical protein
MHEYMPLKIIIYAIKIYKNAKKPLNYALKYFFIFHRKRKEITNL